MRRQIFATVFALATVLCSTLSYLAGYQRGYTNCSTEPQTVARWVEARKKLIAEGWYQTDYGYWIPPPPQRWRR